MAAVWASIYKAAIIGGKFRGQFDFDTDKFGYASGEFLSALATIGVAVGFGTIIGIIVNIFAANLRPDYFRDFTYWSRNDGLNTVL